MNHTLLQKHWRCPDGNFHGLYQEERLGWCPNADVIRSSRCTGTVPECENAWKGRDPGAATFVGGR